MPIIPMAAIDTQIMISNSMSFISYVDDRNIILLLGVHEGKKKRYYSVGNNSASEG